MVGGGSASTKARPGRPSQRRRLSVWMNGVRVGWWETWRGAQPSFDTFEYDSAWLHHPAFRPVSLSMPVVNGMLTQNGPHVRAYFDNLLPDNINIRRRIGRRFGVSPSDSFALLREVGRDCIGALQLLEDEDEAALPGPPQGITLSEYALADYFDSVLSGGPLLHQDNPDDFRISLAGAQEKTALLWHKEQWMLPRGTTPTTHIIKFPLGQVGGNAALTALHSVENEWLCSRILHHFGIPVANTAIQVLGHRKVLVVERFDRDWQGNVLLRLPQEDMCQAFGLPPHMKYERDGGPGINQIARLLEQGHHAQADLATFFRAQALFYALAATDGHAKNFSVYLDRGGAYFLTPLYDVISLLPLVQSPGFPDFHLRRLKLSMAWAQGKKRHYDLFNMRLRHLTGGVDTINKWIDELNDKASIAIAKVEQDIHNHAPDMPASLFENIALTCKVRLHDLVTRYRT